MFLRENITEDRVEKIKVLNEVIVSLNSTTSINSAVFYQEQFLKRNGMLTDKNKKIYDREMFAKESEMLKSIRYSLVMDHDNIIELLESEEDEFVNIRVKEELLNGTYRLETDVEIGVIKDYSALYMIGKGKLTHDENGFTLTSSDGLLNYKQSPLHSYSLNSDYFWYEIGDVISIGDKKELYYCFPSKEVSVTKARLATEELYKLKQKELSK